MKSLIAASIFLMAIIITLCFAIQDAASDTIPRSQIDSVLAENLRKVQEEKLETKRVMDSVFKAWEEGRK